MEQEIINIIFNNFGKNISLSLKKGTTIQELINQYYEKIEKGNLVDENIEKTYFIYNGGTIKYKDNKETIESFFGNKIQIFINVLRLEYDKSYSDYVKTRTIKDNIYTCVYKAKYKDQYIAVKKIKKDQIKEDMKENLYVDEITEEDFKGELIKFNRELTNMKKCHCENSVEIYGYFETEKEFIIAMELCDNTLFKELTKTKNGFSAKEIKKILLQLNNVFKKLNEKNIAHRDLKLQNILVKYLNEEKTKFKVLLSDYGVSNQLNSMTKRYSTHAGTQIIMAPEILSGEDYNNKCDLWSLGVIIFQLYAKKPPYTGQYDNVILNKIDKLGQSVLDIIKDEKLKDLLSKLLIKNPEKRISWEEYFKHDFFK